MRVGRFLPALLLATVSLLAGAGGALGANAASAAPSGTYVCSNGDIPSGTYGSVLVAGTCFIPSGTVAIEGNLTVAPGALLDASTPAGFPGSPAPLPGIVTVGGNVVVGTGAVLFLGCDPHLFCATATTFGKDVVDGNLTATGALGVVVHGVTIKGNATLLRGGGGSVMLTGGPGSGACFGITPPAPWTGDPSLNGTPVYSDFEDNAIGGNLSLIGLESCWLGALRNDVGGNVIALHNLMGDPDANEVVNNTIGGNIACFGNDHVVQFGDSGAAPNIVSGLALGECAFSVEQPDPNYDGGGSQPISVKA